MRILCVCRECGIEFTVKKSDHQKGGGHYCSMNCRHRQSREFGWIKQTYNTAKNRCAYKPAYRNVEFRFTSYEQLATELGPRPTPQHTIDRIDNSGHYEPGNVRWATKKEQTYNREIALLHNGRPLKELAEENGLKYETVHSRITRHGWSVEDALNRPLRRRPRQPASSNDA